MALCNAGVPLLVLRQRVVLGGSDATGIHSTVERYDAYHDTWELVAPMQAISGTSLRQRSAMSGTDLCGYYAVSGTDLYRYQAVSGTSLRDVRRGTTRGKYYGTRRVGRYQESCGGGGVSSTRRQVLPSSPTGTDSRTIGATTLSFSRTAPRATGTAYAMSVLTPAMLLPGGFRYQK
eukprot:1019879-Rhodomonas_salina.2